MEIPLDCLKILAVAFTIAGVISGLLMMVQVLLHAIQSLFEGVRPNPAERRAA